MCDKKELTKNVMFAIVHRSLLPPVQLSRQSCSTQPVTQLTAASSRQHTRSTDHATVQCVSSADSRPPVPARALQTNEVGASTVDATVTVAAAALRLASQHR